MLSHAIADAAVLPEDLVAYIASKITSLCVALLVTYLLLSVLCLAMIAYLRRNRSDALRGDSNAACKLILPAFEPLLWILGFAMGVYSVYFAVELVTDSFPAEIPSIPYEICYAGRQFVLLVVMIFMLQKSVTLPALRRTILITFALSTYTIPFAWYIETHSEPAHAGFNFGLLTVTHALILPLFPYVMVRPPGRASKGSLRLYCAFGITLNVLQLAINTAFYMYEVDIAFTMLYVQLTLGTTCPFFIWRVLQADTAHWRGLGQRACALQSLFRQRANVNERISSQGLHLLVEMHRKFILDFAYLELRQRIGMGSSAVVYNGMLHSKTPVAIKVYTPRSVTEETVAAFSHEAALCGALNHPNIVKFYGMCVSPPTICLVSELCQGSLDVITQHVASKRSTSTADSTRDARRQQFLINIGYMLDTARAVAYIHSFSPAFVHRDIKPANFLVDMDGNVKLTDFGESRSLPQMNHKTTTPAAPSTTTTAAAPPTSRSEGDSGFVTTTSATSATRAGVGTDSLSSTSSPLSTDSVAYVDYDRVRKSDVHGNNSSNHHSVRIQLHTVEDSPQLPSHPSIDRPQMTVKGTADYMAPEMINGRGGFAAYGEAADVYSLAITMWDILHPGREKYPHSKSNPLRVFETVVAGSRPSLDTRTLPPQLCDLLANSWHQDYWRRPSAQAIVHALERIQEDVAATFALELSDKLQQDATLVKGDDGVLVRSTTGILAVERMKAIGAIAAMSEGVRLGNLLMNAGFLHHAKHARSFEYARDASYYFDETNIRFCQPFAMLESGGDDGSGARSDPSHHNACDALHDTTAAATTQWQPLVTSKAELQHRTAQHDIASLGTEPCEELYQHHDDTTGSNAGSGGNPAVVCECKRLGQRLVSRRPAKRFFLRRNQQQQQEPIPEDAALTATLLAQDNTNGNGGGSGSSILGGRSIGMGMGPRRSSDSRSHALNSNNHTLSPRHTGM